MSKTSDEGTSYCPQCEAWARENAKLRKKPADWEHTIRVELDIKIKWDRIESVKLVGQKPIRNFRADRREGNK